MSQLTDALREALVPLSLTLTDAQYAAFDAYYALLVDWNGRMNLTAITDPVEVAQKHFADSLLPLAFGMIPEGARCIDVGTGAGFPGVPLLIARPDLDMTLLDSLAKRLKFLDAVLSELSLKAKTIHARAEEGGRMSHLRAGFDAVLSRAVAPAPVLLELTLPFAKVGGASVCFKGPALSEELSQAKRALTLLNGRVERVETLSLPWGERRIARIEKTAKTPPAYPRKPGTPAKTPL